MAIYRDKKQIQPKWPLRIDDTYGPYASVSSPAQSIKQDFIFLLKTIPGEWPMNPDLGIGLATYLFETYDSIELSSIKTNIDIQLKKYLSNIKILDAKFVSSDENRDHFISILSIDYIITDLNLRDEISFGLREMDKSLVYLEDRNQQSENLLGN